MPAPRSNLTLVTGSAEQPGESEFWLSEPESIDDGNGNWGFTVYADKDIFIATFTYTNQADAMRAWLEMVEVLKGAVFIATTES